jgi:hypothetical protein
MGSIARSMGRFNQYDFGLIFVVNRSKMKKEQAQGASYISDNMVRMFLQVTENDLTMKVDLDQ